jgi:alcohol dehydrogenase (cytochrome c)
MGAGFTAPPISFAVNGKQYIAIATGLSRIARSTLERSPEIAEMRNATVLYVFALD